MAYKVKKDPIDKIPKAQFVFWIIVRISMLVCAGYSFIHGDLVMGFESVFCFIFTHLWDMFQVFGNGSFIEEVPPLSQTMLNIIIFIYTFPVKELFIVSWKNLVLIISRNANPTALQKLIKKPVNQMI